MTGYTKIGPTIALLAWSSLDERLREAEAIVSDSAASSVRLQQAEEELRLAACQLASIAAKRKLGRETSPHNMNKGNVRAILVAAGTTEAAVDRIQAMFINADDSHHAPKNYQPNVQRIRQGIAAIRDVKAALVI
jgi:hypothetical protein